MKFMEFWKSSATFWKLHGLDVPQASVLKASAMRDRPVVVAASINYKTLLGAKEEIYIVRTTKYRLEDGCAVYSGKLTKPIDFKAFTEALWWCTDSEDICWLTGDTLARAFRENLAYWKDDGGNHPEGLDDYDLRAVIFEKRGKSEWILIAPELPPGQRFRLRVQPPQLRHEGGRVTISDVVVPSL